MRLASISALFLLAGCGLQEKKDPGKVTEYYVEDQTFDGDATAAEDGGAGPTGTKPAGKLKFATPAADATANGKVKISVAFTGASDGATWSIYYAMSAKATDGVEIAADLPATETSVDWDTQGLTPAVYYLYAELTDGGETTRHNAAAKITVKAKDGSGPVTNTKPTLSLTSPNGENVFVAGVPQAVTFAAADADKDKLIYKVEYSADGGTTWKVAADKLDAPTFSWDVAGLAQGINYRVRVSADDGKGGVAQVTSAKSFGVATKPMTFAGAMGEMLATNCAGCHAGAGPNIGVFRSDDFDLATVGVSDKQTNIKKRVDANTMPPAAPLSAADREVMTMWLWSGAQ